jgi:iron(III) transport system ATP-binding protein
MYFELKNISHSYGKKSFGLADISFTASAGEIVALLGESGSGKTTLLRIIAGFEIPDKGTIKLDNEILVNENISLPPEKRKTGLVFQEHALFPHLRIEKNILYGVRRGTDASKKLKEMMELTGLQGLEKRYPHELSGGQQQRVAIARSLAAEPKLLLLDEPFSNLDDSIKTQVRTEIRGILKMAGISCIFVTHDTQDCLAVADHIVILQNGKILQNGNPETIYHNPASNYIARLFGPVNEFSKEELNALGLNDSSYLIRPELLQLTETGGIETRVIGSYFAGTHYAILCDTGKRIIEVFHNANIETGKQINVFKK